MATHDGTINIEAVFKGFTNPDGRPIHALDDITLDIHPREFVAIIGTSGCGKSTLLRMIAGLEFPDAGQLLFDGDPISGPDRLRGLVFQDPNLFPWLTVRQNIAFGLKMRRRHKSEAAKLAELLRLVGLEDFARAWPFQLSGGMAQRTALARTLANEPEVLLLDEPLGALDSFTRMTMQDEILKVWEQSRPTAVMVTHDVDEAIYMSDRIVVMTPRPGRIREVIDIPLGRPRKRNSPDFLALRTRILEIFDFAHREQDAEYLL